MTITIGFDNSALDPKFKSHAQRGIGRYVSELKRYFAEFPSSKVNIESFDHRQFKDRGLINSLVDYLPAGKQTIRQQVVYPFRLKNHKQIDYFHFPAQMDAPSWSLNNYILTVLDLIPLVLSDLYKANKPGWRFTFARWLEIRAIKNASLILAISQNTANDLVNVLNIPSEKIIVTPLGVNEEFFIEPGADDKINLLEKLGLPTDRHIVLYVGGIDPRKNYQGLIESFSILCQKLERASSSKPLLVLAGGINQDREYPRLKNLIAENNLEGDVKELGFVSNDDLPSLYAASAVLFFPSLYEGFGLTPLEALATGTPVVSSNTSCMPEVLGKAALLVNPHDRDACANALHDVLTVNTLREELRIAGRKHARTYPWTRTGELTLAAYERLIANKKVANL
jgi:glycosyltransferase involved in cell wall biosynthesis